MNIELLSFLRNNSTYSSKLLNIRQIEETLKNEHVEDIAQLVQENIIQTFEHMNSTVTSNIIPLSQHLKEIGETKEEYLLFKDFLIREKPFSMNALLLFVDERPISKRPELLVGDYNITEIAHNNSWQLRLEVIRAEETNAREALVGYDRSKEILRDHNIAKEMKTVVEKHLDLLGSNRAEESAIETKDISKMLQAAISLNQGIGQQLQQSALQKGQSQQLQPLNAMEEKLQLNAADANRPLTDDEIALAERFERDMAQFELQKQRERENNE